ncbi:hypothetical protein ACEWY4_025001 [Coilia grayii]|uniref:Uncharacterized protein n=1 Tax=Coilia grayii TaxID=363190 RepID=A0ABD1IWN8_9TELE
MSSLGESEDATKETMDVSETVDKGSSACDGSHKKDTNLSRCSHENTCEARETEGTGNAQCQEAKTNNRSGIPVQKRLAEDGSHKPVPSVMSMKSERSMGLPGNFKGDLTQDTQIHLDQLDSSSIVSSAMTSNVSEQWISSRVYYPVIPREGVPCDVCSKKAVKSCLTCCASFCEDHIKMHYTAPALQRHKLVEATRDLEERLCQQHSRHLELFCQTNNALICALCSVEEHKGHEITADPKELDIIQIVQMKEPEWVIKEELPPPGPIKFSSVKADSVTISWDTPEGQTGSQRFRVSVKCSREQRYLEVQNLKLHFQGLAPHEEYDFMVASVYGEHSQSTWVSTSLCTVVPVPKGLAVTTDETSISVTWGQPDGTDRVSYLVTLSKSHECLQTISTEALECSFSELLPGTMYSIDAVSVLKNGYESDPVVKSCLTKIHVPENLRIDSITTTTVNLSWSLSDEMDQVPHKFLISYSQYSRTVSDNVETVSTDSCHGIITGLKPHTEYSIVVSTIVENVGKSEGACIYVLTGLLPVTDVTVNLQSSRAHISWLHKQEILQHSCFFLTSCRSDESDLLLTRNTSYSAYFEKLKPNTEYTVTVTAVITNRSWCASGAVSEIKSNPVSTSFVTGLPPPGPIQFTSVGTDSVSLTWGFPEGLTSHPKFKVSLCLVTEGDQNNQINLPRREVVPLSYFEDENDSDCMIVHCLQATFVGLNPGTAYNITVATLSEEGKRASPSVSATTRTAIPEPVDFDLNFKDLSLTWGQPAGVSGKSYQLNFFRDEKCFKAIRTPSLTWPLGDLMTKG